LFSGLSARLAGVYVMTTRSYAATSALFATGSVLVLSMIVYLAVEVFSLRGATVILLLFLFGRLVPRFSGIQRGYQYFVNSLPAFAAVCRLIGECEAVCEAPPAHAQPLRLGSEVRLRNVDFAYRAEAGVRTIEQLNLNVPARCTTAVVGPSGAGKSTIADLIMGLITPAAGEILVDGTLLRSDRAHDWRQQIGYVPQDTFLFHDTVRANLLWAQPDASEQDLWEALRLAAADTLVTRLTEGMDTVIGDRGVLLSGGERQRLALARALLRRPQLLILDEATSALDSENERRIQAAIRQLHGRLTILVITHRLSSIRGADVIHVIEEGRLVESGTWKSLTARRDGRFSALCAAQGILRRRTRVARPVTSEAGVA
jgi:ATP-binding cassette subfamily C protein